MNAQYPFSNPIIPPYIPLNPNPNPSVNSNIPFLHQPQFNPIPPADQIPLPDLPTSLSSLQNLLKLSQSTLHSLSSVVPTLHESSNSLARCPSNPHHWVPPKSVFLHSLHCPTSIDVNPVLESLHYPKTLKSEQQLIEQNRFVQPLQDPSSELCFSLDDYVDFDSNFFYQNCPGVVNLSDHDVSQGRIFSLPGVLSVQCANFVSHSGRETEDIQVNRVRALPSEVWIIHREVEQWGDYLNGYPYCVLKAILYLQHAKECDLSMWLIMNSPQFGVVIDAPMRDHILVLFSLCLKAIFKEALHSYKSAFNIEVDNNGGKLNPKSLNFECPAMIEVLRWLSSQVSILYGETNAKSLIINMLKHLLPKVASRAILFPLEKGSDQTLVSDLEPNIFTNLLSGNITDNEGDGRGEETLLSKPVFVYQIAAAIAALHERSILEARIIALRTHMPLTCFQRSLEHMHLSNKAIEERRKRPDYKPLIEHDGLPLQRHHDQDSDRIKTREEMLAEERDYKRRRMSYRGKKLKRTTKEVMRDIIEDYMETIRRAGGIGCLTKGNEGTTSTFKTSHIHVLTNFKPKDNMNDLRDCHGKLSQNDHSIRGTKSIDALHGRYERQRKETHSHGRFDRGPSSDRNERQYYSRSPSRDGRYGCSKEHRGKKRNGDMTEMNLDEHLEINHPSKTSRNHDLNLPFSTSSGLSISYGRKDRWKSDSNDRYTRQRQDYHKYDPSRKDEFNDRYDPSSTSDDYGNMYDDCEYTRPRS